MINFGNDFLNRDVNIFKKYYYFDANGTTPLHPDALISYKKSAYLGNASSLYANEARNIIERAKNTLKKWTNSINHKVIFNSGASEGNNHVFHGIATGSNKQVRPHFIVSSIEHKTSIECVKHLAKLNLIEITWVEPNPWGIVSANSVAPLIQSNTVLISVMAVNNELGTRNDIYGISRLIREMEISNGQKIIYHCDVVQLIGKESINMTIGPHIITGSFHKMYGPQGLGFIIADCVKVKEIDPQIFGSQFEGLRGGTENIPAIAAAETAMISTFSNRIAKNNRLTEMKLYILKHLRKEFSLLRSIDFRGLPDDIMIPKQYSDISIVPMGNDDVICNTLTISFVKCDVPIENKFCNIILRQDLFDKNIIVSIGSACNTNKSEPSHVLKAIKMPFPIRAGIIRISLNDTNTWSEVYYLVNTLISCVKKQI